jgi:hypothetical protein
MKRLLCALALVASTAAPALADPKSDLIAAMIQFARVTSYHVTATDHGKTVEMDMALPGKMHLMMGPVEMIKIDAVTWIKMNGSWHQFTVPGMDRITSGVTHAIGYASGKYGPNDMVVRDLGMMSPDGVPLHAYSVVTTSSKDAATLYLDRDGKLIRVDTTDGAIVRFSKFNAIDPIVPPPL